MDNQSINRRQFLAGLSAALGVALTPSAVRAAEKMLANDANSMPLTLDNKQLEIVRIIADIIIPETDTPSASGAGVHHFINQSVTYFFSSKQREDFKQGIQQASIVSEMTPEQQVAQVERWDDNRHNEPFFEQLKRLVIFGYYTSEAGATQELRYDPIPGPFKEVPLSEIGRAWA